MKTHGGEFKLVVRKQYTIVVYALSCKLSCTSKINSSQTDLNANHELMVNKKM